MDSPQTLLRAAALYWLFFGLLCTLSPKTMSFLLLTSQGQLYDNDGFAQQLWFHQGMDVLAVAGFFYGVSRLPSPPKSLLRASAMAAFAPTAAIVWSYLRTPYWNPLVLLAGAGCAAIGVSALRMSAHASGE